MIMTRPPDAKEIETIRSKKESAIIAQDFEKAAALRDAEKQSQDKLERIVNEWRKKGKEREVVVTGEDIIHIVSKWTGVPLTAWSNPSTPNGSSCSACRSRFYLFDRDLAQSDRVL